MIIVGDDRDTTSFPFVTPLIMTTCILVFLCSLLYPTLNNSLAVIPAHLSSRYYYTLVTSIFCHIDILHIGLNMLVFWGFAKSVEDKVGPLAFLVLYLGCGIAGNLLYAFLHPYSTIPALGASGSIFGIMGIYLVFFPRQNLKLLTWYMMSLRTFLVPAYVVIFLYAVIEFFSIKNEDNGGVAHSAHIGGFLFGLVVGLIFNNSSDKDIKDVKLRK